MLNLGRLFTRWLDDLHEVRSAGLTGWLERVFLFVLVLQRPISLAYWLTSPIPNVGGSRRHRDGRVEVYVLAWLVLLGLLWAFTPGSWVWLAAVLAWYLLWEMFHSLFSITFLGKLREVNEPPSSVERSLILLLVNAAQLLLAFALLYRHEFGFTAAESLGWSALVLGTVSYPSETGTTSPVVVIQICLDLLFIALFFGSFAGQMGIFKGIVKHHD
jgi:hypothetical protein